MGFAGALLIDELGQFRTGLRICPARSAPPSDWRCAWRDRAYVGDFASWMPSKCSSAAQILWIA